MKEQEIIDIVYELNCDLYEKQDDLYERNKYEYPSFLELSCNGYITGINYLGLQIWNTEDDEREYIDEEKDIKESLKNYLIRKINEINSFVGKIKL